MAKKSLSGIDLRAPLLANGSSGTTGQILTSQGSSSIPTWVTPTASSFTISETAPLNPNAKDQWLDSSRGFLYVYFNDGTSSQWIQIGNSNTAVATSIDPLLLMGV